MKYGKKYMFVAGAALLWGMQSCDFEGIQSCREVLGIRVQKTGGVLKPLSIRVRLFGAGQFY